MYHLWEVPQIIALCARKGERERERGEEKERDRERETTQADSACPRPDSTLSVASSSDEAELDLYNGARAKTVTPAPKRHTEGEVWREGDAPDSAHHVDVARAQRKRVGKPLALT